MSRRALLAVFVMVLTPPALLAQQPAQKPEKAAAPSAEQAKPDYSQEPFVVEQFNNRARFENDGTGRRETSIRIHVQSEPGVQQLGQLVFGYNSSSEKLEIDWVHVQKADGTTSEVSAGDVQDMTAPVAREAPVYTDFRQKHVTVPGLRPGDILSYHITKTIHTPLAAGQFWFEHDFLKEAIVLDEFLELNVPRDRAIKLKTHPDALPVISEEGGRRIYRWKSSFLKREDESGEEKKPKKKAAKKPEGPAVQLTTFQNWEEVGRWYAGIQRERAAPDGAIRAKTGELVRGQTSDLAKIEALYDFVAKNFRYVSLSFGVGRYQPHAAQEVLANQYGDCKDKHTLLQALMAAAGYSAGPVLINSQRKIDPDVPSPAQFDHVITAVPLGQELIWMDSTTEVAAFRQLSANLRKKQALLIPTAPSHAAPGLVETPADLPFPATQRVEVEGQVSDLGKLTAKVRYTLRGDNELLLRLGFRRTPQNQWKALAQLLATSDGFRGEVSEVHAGDPAATREPFWVEYQIAQPNYLDWSRKKSQLALPLPGVGLPEARESDDETDAEPLELGTPLEVITRVKLEFPATYATRAPVGVAVMRDYAEYRSSYKVEGNKLTAERSLRFKLRELPAARTRDYLTFVRAVRSDEEQSLALESTAPGTPSLPAEAKAGELYEAGVAALRSGNFPVATDLFARVVALEPNHKSAWAELGRSYLLQAKFDEGISALRKQIEVDPYHTQAHLLLGLALTQRQKYDEAAVAFRKQLELNPLDRQALAALSGVYLEQHKYAEAVTELEKAVSLAPDNAGLRVSLGQAYLNLGQTEQALAAFDKAVEISPEPAVWNNIAYQLSLKKERLERAQQYAESAVATTAAELRNTSLDRLRSEDLGRVVSLAAQWDTLGWVHFQRGDVETAEKYIRAAWLLGQHGEVSDHLGQIFEKRGQKPEAIHAYALALAAYRPIPETPGRLAQLVGGEDKVKPLVENAGGELSQMRTVKLGKLLKESATAEFFLLLAPAAFGGSVRVEEVKFVSGSEKLRPLSEAVRSAQFPAEFPGDTPTKLVRRGVLSCSAPLGECIFVLYPLEQVTSVN